MSKLNMESPQFDERVIELRSELVDSIELFVKQQLVKPTKENVEKCIQLIHERVENMCEVTFTQALNQVCIAVMTVNNEIE